MRRSFVTLAAAAFGALSLLAPTATNAATLYDVGPAGLVQAAQPPTELTVATVPVPTESHLPGWIQTVVARASLYAADTASDQVVASLSRHSFLRVIDGGTARLQVQAYDDDGNPAQTGWVEAEQVLPSAPGIDWLVTSTPTVLYAASDATSAVRNLDRFTPLQKLDGQSLDGRTLVRVYRSDFSGVVDQGWVDASATGPALPPQSRVPAPTAQTAGLRTPTASNQQQAFLDAAAQAARQATAQTHVPASVTVAQAILESDWGRSELATDANNFFGMKAMGTLGNDGVVYMPTSEYDADGNLYRITDAFRAYKSLADSMADHDHLLQTAKRYAAAMQATSDPRKFAVLIQQAGYSTDPSYADKLVALMDKYNLYQLDA